MGDQTSSGRDARDKGKAAEPNPDPTPKDGATEKKDSGTLLPRVVQSAASFLLSGSRGAELGGGNEKGESSRVGEALARAGENSIRLRSNVPSHETMRVEQAGEHIAQEEASFAEFLESGSTPMLSEPSDLEGAWRSAVPVGTRTTGSRSVAVQSVAQQEANDGADVVALLSGDGDLDEIFNTVAEPPSQDDLARLRRALFGEGTDHGTSSIAWDNVLNFIPDFFQADTASAAISPCDNLSMHMGIGDADEAWQAWISQWSRVLTSYQDEVWGDLSVLVEEARAEVRRIEKAKPGGKAPEPTALLRLRAILGHLRGA